ncbi:related to pseudouridine synthase [Rhynchosporium agropyri]|uniref:tRNA pseudouridine(55) synthase n=1 Tax=Rhynchosporium agropyri TaxID=914238 RepID=A0A1E1KY61_9HELO|nr:related to pseudouridine synthase [Rhynchosporium agropyri]
MTPKKIMEGVFAVRKPTGVSSAQVLRDLQKHFNPSELFAPWLAAERAARERESHNQRKRRKEKQIQVKIGHGGTLDPLATGVLIAGVGKGTKSLQDFLLCTKVYETVVLFGTDTDTYDRVGKVLKRGPYDHITREMVEEALEQFRGKFMQLPPLYSALKMNGKPLYEYAREGKEIPKEIQRREVEVLNLELVEWMEGGTHSHVAPSDEAGHAEINIASKLWKQENVQPGARPGKMEKVKSEPEATEVGSAKTFVDKVNEEANLEKAHGFVNSSKAVNATVEESAIQPAPETESATTPIPNEEEDLARENFERKKRKFSEDQDDLILERPPTKSRKAAPPSSAETAMMSGGLPSPTEESAPQPSIETSPVAEAENKDKPKDQIKEEAMEDTNTDIKEETSEDSKPKGPPAVRLRMTVTSGFYVRSLCHDLGAAVGSAALMAELERTRQGEFELGKNVLEWEELEKGEEVWAPRVEKFLDEWHEKTKMSSDASKARSS